MGREAPQGVLAQFVGEMVAVVAAHVGDPAEAPIGHAAYDRRMVREVLTRIEPSARATDLEGGLLRTLEILKQSPAAEGNRAVYLITDLAKTDWRPEGGAGPAAA